MVKQFKQPSQEPPKSLGVYMSGKKEYRYISLKKTAEENHLLAGHLGEQNKQSLRIGLFLMRQEKAIREIMKGLIFAP